jgi:WhiB family transcriptional regulator, redox-sensing transcriptional regulator
MTMTVQLPTGKVRLPTPKPFIAAPWRADAACASSDPTVFYVERGCSSRAARRICENCPVRAECLEYALQNNEQFGIWGGMSERQRRELRRQRRERESQRLAS